MAKQCAVKVELEDTGLWLRGPPRNQRGLLTPNLKSFEFCKVGRRMSCQGL